MRWLGVILALGLFTAVTGGAFMASLTGWGLSGMLDKPVSIRQQSVRHRRSGVPALLYFSSGSRRHYGGGFRGGK